MKVKDITLIIPTYDRPEHLKRKLYHLYSLKCKIQIEIYDSSIKKVIRNNKKTVNDYKDKLYLKLYQTRENLGYIQKVFLAIGKVKTKYVVIHPDDDFLLVNTILKCKSFLDTSNKYTNCTGVSLKFDKNKNKILTMISNNHVQDNDDSIERARKLFISKKDKITIYNVWRTKSLYDVLKPISGTPYLKYSEFFLGFLSAFNGPTKLLKDLYEIKTIEYHKSKRREKSLPKFEENKFYSLINLDFYNDFKKFINYSLIFLRKKGVKNKDSKILIVKLFVDKFFNTYKRNGFSNKKELVPNFVKKIKYLKIFFSFRKINLTRKMISYYGLHKTLIMINNDKDFEFNVFSLKDKNSKYFNFYCTVENCLKKFPKL